MHPLRLADHVAPLDRRADQRRAHDRGAGALRAGGGIEFASPPGTPRAKPGTVFFLYSEPKKEWLGWAPKIPIAPEK